MLCTYCGAISSPTLDRCTVCHTPFPQSVLHEGTSDTDPDADATRLAPSSGDRTAPAADVTGIPRLQAGQTFANRYTIIRLLGAGGMAAVYQAWDETLATAVALKLIRIDPTMEPADVRQLEERFKRELKLARQVTHPNVVRIHDLGEVGGTLYLTMAYVQGSDLATVLQRDGKMSIARVLSLAKQMVSGLAAAHRASVVHRDLKPANILVDAEDNALLTDFGIARSKGGDQTLLTEVGIVRSPTGSTLQTMPGAIMGTLEYMAPEQLRADPADERTDIYACGLILYELIAGGRPRGSARGMQELMARIQQGPPALRTIVPDVPTEVDRIIAKCLKSDAAARYATADELLVDLHGLDQDGNLLPVMRRIPRWKVLSAAAVLGALLVTGTWWIAATQLAVPAARDAVPVLITDFENRTQEPVFNGTLEQALTIGMEGAPFITAYPRTDAAKLLPELKQDKLNENAGLLVAKREGIRVILAGSIERAGSGYRVAVRAIDPEKPETPLTVAQERAADKAAVLGAVGKVAERVRKALGDTTTSAQQQAETFTAASLDAVKEYTIAQALASQQQDEEAVKHYLEALKYDPGFGRAHAGLAMSRYYLGQRREAEGDWEKALEGIDRMSEREKWRTRGSYFAGPRRNFAQAIEEYRNLVDKYPADRAGHNNLAVAYFSTLDFNNALKHGKRAIEIYPKSFKFRANYALYAMYAGDFKTAAETAQALIAEDPAFETAYLPLAMAALSAGEPDRARRIYEEAAQKAGTAGASLAAIGLADVAIYQGRSDEALAALPDAIKRDIDQKNTYGAVAKLLAQAEAHAARNQAGPVQQALSKARALADDDNVLVTAARLAVSAGRMEQAKVIAEEMSKRDPSQSRAYAELIGAEMDIAAKRYQDAIDKLHLARKFMNLWLVRYTLGRAYFEKENYRAALSEFEECQRRRGEATALFLDDLPTFRYYATVPYWLGRAREAQRLDPRTQYEEFLKIRAGAERDPLVQDAQRRMAALPKAR